MKKKILGITLAVCLLVLSIAGSTLAYFTSTDAKATVFTSGNVEIKFDGDVFLNSANTTVTAHPGMEIGTAAKVENVGSEQAYVGIVITFNKAIDKAVDEGDLDVTELFGKLADPSDKYVVNYVKGSNKTEIFVVYKDALNKTASVDFFEDIVIPLEWDNEDMEIFNDLKITLSAYATQTYGMGDNAANALNAAFPDVWPTVSAGN